jgi:hypothetical protein
LSHSTKTLVPENSLFSSLGALKINQPTKELTEGGDLREVLSFNASLGSKTDTLLYKRGFAYAVYSPDSRPGLVTLKATGLRAHRLPICEEQLWLDGYLGIESRVAYSRHSFEVGTLVKTPCERGMRAVTRYFNCILA